MVLVITLILVVDVSGLKAQDGVAPDGQIPQFDQACRLCHAGSEAVVEFPSGEALPVAVDPAAFDASAHGHLAAEAPLDCTNCHGAAEYRYPHPPVEVESLRAYEIGRAQLCERCHQPHLTSHPGPDSESPVVCTDCHTAHEVLTVEQWHDGAGVDTCVECHADAEVPLTDPERLNTLIRGDFFAPRISEEYCLSCHSQPDLSLTFPNGDTISLSVDEESLAHSVHGDDNEWRALDCTDCHGAKTYPHEPVTAESARDYRLQNYELCAGCHEQKYEQTQDSVHAAALAAGQEEAAVCTDCHGAHDTPPPSVPRERISHTCQQCHSTVFDAYASSVHGEALLGEDNPDVPVCIDCHGVHNIGDPTTAEFRARSPALCARCHADAELMAKYDISTDVFETYVADFHGTTVTLFESDDPNAHPNEAVCYDCHGIHAIEDPDDPQNGIKANLLETCRQCHPDASENFPSAWTSHYRPSLDNNPLVFLVEVFYWIIIPGTVGLFGFLVVTDIYRRLRKR
jgi:predicted CXXCH cytochrome family protein